VELSRSAIILIGVALIAAIFLFTPYEAFFEGIVALAIVVASLVGFLMHPRRQVYYVRTAVLLIDSDRNQSEERDFLAVRVELVRLWLLFIPTFLAVADLVFFAAGGPAKFSYLNWIFSSLYGSMVMAVLEYLPLLVLLSLSAWLEERRVMSNADACGATSFSFSHSPAGRVVRVTYAFKGEHGEYYGGDCLYFGLVRPLELATIVFYDVRKPELNKIGMGLLFHRLIMLGRGVTDLDKQTAAGQAALVETTQLS
jgi:hypothetical protein